MARSKIIFFAVIALAGVVASVILQHKAQVKFDERVSLLRIQDEKLTAMTKEHQRLANLLVQTDAASPGGRMAEMAKLRREAEALKKQKTNLAAQMPKRSEARSSQPAPPTEARSKEYWVQLHQMARSKATDARNIASAMSSFAADHHGQVPSDFDQITSYLKDMPVSGTNQFEIVYHGSLDKLEGVARGNIAVVREQQTWAGPDGRLIRVYGMADGHGETVGSDDDLEAWEAEHIIAETKPGR